MDWMRTLIYACTVLTISASALDLSPRFVAAVGIISLVATYRLQLFTDGAVDTALQTEPPTNESAEKVPL